MSTKLQCTVCGGAQFTQQAVLWPELINAWQLSSEEAGYIDRQQGQNCTACGANLRSIALANALRSSFGTQALLRDFCGSPAAAKLRLIEINQAGTLHPVLRTLPGHVFVEYPKVDMHALPFADGAFDIVVHSDTLEHVANPVHALGECRRVLAPNGVLCFTVPIVVGRMSRGRDGLPKSWHGDPKQSGDDFLVQTEFGADAWTYVLQAGFAQVTVFSVAYPAAIALAARS